MRQKAAVDAAMRLGIRNEADLIRFKIALANLGLTIQSFSRDSPEYQRAKAELRDLARRLPFTYRVKLKVLHFWDVVAHPVYTVRAVRDRLAVEQRARQNKQGGI